MCVLYREHHVDDRGRHIRAINEADEGISLYDVTIVSHFEVKPNVSIAL